MQPERYKLLLALAGTACFIPAFVLNITDNEPLYNLDLNVVPEWQNNAFLGSAAFLTFMNIVSVLLDPPVCAAYLVLFWLVSSRKLEIMVFLIWFIFLSWLLSVGKSAIQQARPFWLFGSDIRMNSWTCYTDFGCPSGHSMMGLVLLQFIISFYSRWHAPVQRKVVWLYLLMAIVEGLLMFSRVILGMHTFNQVLMGVMVGAFSLAVYYTYAEAFIVKIVATVLNSKEAHPYFSQLPAQQRKKTFIGIMAGCLLVVVAIDLIVYFVPEYQTTPYWAVILGFPECSGAKLERSFQYRSLQDMGIIMAAFGLVFSLIFITSPSAYVRPLAYSRLSLKFLAKITIQILLALVPLAVFVNPGWNHIEVEVAWLSVILWVCQSLGYFLSLVMLVVVGSVIGKRLGLDQHEDVDYERVECEMRESPRERSV